MTFLTILFLLLCVHAVADYPLQSDFMAQQKSPWCPQPLQAGFWWWCLAAHCLIHALGVWLVASEVRSQGSGFLSQSPMLLALAEFALHFAIDVGKCAKRYGVHVDQSLHVGCKVWWAAIIAA